MRARRNSLASWHAAGRGATKMNKSERELIAMIKRVAAELNAEQADRYLRKRMSETVKSEPETMAVCDFCERTVPLAETHIRQGLYICDECIQS
jgi:hypothetical protein